MCVCVCVCEHVCACMFVATSSRKVNANEFNTKAFSSMVNTFFFPSICPLIFMVNCTRPAQFLLCKCMKLLFRSHFFLSHTTISSSFVFLLRFSWWWFFFCFRKFVWFCFVLFLGCSIFENAQALLKYFIRIV